MTLQYEILKSIVKSANIKKRWAGMSTEELLENRRRENAKNRIPDLKDDAFMISRVEVMGCPVLKLIHKEKTEKANLFLIGGGMVSAPRPGSIKKALRFAKETGLDLFVPYYPLCTDYPLTRAYEMIHETYRMMLRDYRAENISVLGTSSGGNLALGMVPYINDSHDDTPMPSYIMAISPGTCVETEEEWQRMLELDKKDVAIPAEYMKTAVEIMRHGDDSVPDYMIWLQKGDFSNCPRVTFIYGSDETLFACAPSFEAAMKKYGVDYEMIVREGMFHCYPVFPICKEAKEGWDLMIQKMKEGTEERMEPDYKNWMPKGMVQGTLAGAVGCLGLAAVCGGTGLIKNRKLKTAATGALMLSGAAASGAALWMETLYRAFSYDGKRQMSRQIIEGIANYVTLPEGGVGLDVGCGSGALTIACAKRNPQARFVGVDRWGKEYASYNKALCEANAKAEGMLSAAIGIHDPLRPEAGEIVELLHEAGIGKTVMLTGDSRNTAAAIARKLRIDDYHAEVLPEDKARYIQEEQEQGRIVVMIGDGINDAPALSLADVGIAIGSGATIAREVADITIAAEDLRELVLLRRLSEKLMRRIGRNYRFVMGFNGALIGLGAFGLLQPSTSALLHNSSTLLLSMDCLTDLLTE